MSLFSQVWGKLRATFSATATQKGDLAPDVNTGQWSIYRAASARILEDQGYKGVANGYPELNGSGYVPHGQLGSGGGSGTKYLRDDNTWQAAAGGVADGDYGDLTVSGGGSVWTIDAGAVTLAKMADIATDRLIGRDTAGTGLPEAITVGGGVEFSGSGGIRRSALSGDVSAAAGSSTVSVDKVAGTTPGATGLSCLAAATAAAGRTAIGIATGTNTDHVLGWDGSSWVARLIVLPASVYVSSYVQEWPAGWGENAVDPIVAIGGVIS